MYLPQAPEARKKATTAADNSIRRDATGGSTDAKKTGGSESFRPHIGFTPKMGEEARDVPETGSSAGEHHVIYVHRHSAARAKRVPTTLVPNLTLPPPGDSR